MKRIFIYATLISLYFSIPAMAQNYDADSIHYTAIPKPKQKVKKEEAGASNLTSYFFSIQSSALIGCNNCAQGKEVTFSAATIQGVTIGKKLRAGLGIGFDSYQNWQTLPIFGMASWDLIGNKNANALFVQVAYGWAHPWFVRDGAYANYSSDPFTNVSGGRMINPQIGYRLAYYKLRLSFAVGYKFQRIFYSQPNYYPYFNCPQCDYTITTTVSSSDITQDMNRVQLVMSVGWK